MPPFETSLTTTSSINSKQHSSQHSPYQPRQPPTANMQFSSVLSLVFASIVAAQDVVSAS